jgi:rSAM/selenodomain-associated transferase 1
MGTTVSDMSNGSTCAIAIMAKASMPGCSKTRLVPPLTPEEAARFNTAFLCDIADNILAASAAAPIKGYAAFGPPESRPFFLETLPPEIGLIDSWFPNFGDCLFTAINQLLERGHPSAVVLNSDSPTLPTSLIIETAQVLAQPGDRVVLGPSSDGGYYLLGVKSAHRRLFEDIAWSTNLVSRQTRDRADELGLPVHKLPGWYDIDDFTGLRVLNEELFENPSIASQLGPNQPRHTRRLMEALSERTDLQDRLSPEAYRSVTEHGQFA